LRRSTIDLAMFGGNSWNPALFNIITKEDNHMFESRSNYHNILKRKICVRVS